MTVPYKPQQSPIDLGKAPNVAAVFPAHYLDLRWDGPLDGKPKGGAGDLDFVFDNINPRVGIALGGKFFHLKGYHFHAPSEHKVNDREWPLELHIVHQSPVDSLFAVLGIWVEAGRGRQECNRFFDDFARHLALKADPATTITHDPRDLLPVDRGDFYRYEGSLTTNTTADNPETVSWLIFRETLRVDRATLDEFLRHAHESKPVQDPARRFVLRNFVA